MEEGEKKGKIRRGKQEEKLASFMSILIAVLYCSHLLHVCSLLHFIIFDVVFLWTCLQTFGICTSGEEFQVAWMAFNCKLVWLPLYSINLLHPLQPNPPPCWPCWLRRSPRERHIWGSIPAFAVEIFRVELYQWLKNQYSSDCSARRLASNEGVGDG